MLDYHSYTLAQHLKNEYQAELAQEREDNEFNRLDAELAQLLAQHGFEDIYEHLVGTDLWVDALTRKAQENVNNKALYF